MPTSVPPPAPGSAPAKKGLPPWAWLAIGCGGLIVVSVVVFLLLGMFVFSKGKDMFEEATGSGSVSGFMESLQEDPIRTAAEAMIRMNPDLDLISTDKAAGTITFRDNTSGEEATLNFEDIAEGRFSTTTDEGNFTIDATEGSQGGMTFTGPEGEARFGASTDLSSIPDWVPSYPGATDIQGTMSASTADGVMGAFTGKTSDSAQKVVDHFKSLFEGLGFKIGAESMTRIGEESLGAITGELAVEGRSINIMVLESDEGSVVTINYHQKKQ